MHLPPVIARVAAVQAATASSISICSHATKPDNASASVPATFAGYAFEEASFPYYTGNSSHPSLFSRNLLNAISNKTGAAPVIRVGALLYHATYDPSLLEPIYNPEPSSGIPKHLKIGPSFFGLFENFPDAKYIADIPWYKNHLSNSLDFAKEAYRSIGNNIYAFEIGNEPDNYGDAARPGGWTEKEFSDQWGKWSRAISTNLNVSIDRPIFEAVALSSRTGITGTPGGGAKSWKIGQIFKQGGMSKFKGRMKTISMHYYQTKADKSSDLQSDLMNHNKVLKGTSFIKTAIKDSWG